jgi:ketosteroid isomerase-like protein
MDAPLIAVQVLLGVDSDPIRGTVRTTDEPAVPFTGWIELTHLLARAHQGDQGDRSHLDASVGAVADRFADAFLRGDTDLLGGLYAAELRFTSHADGTVRDREQALAAFRTLRPQLRDLTLEVIDRHVSEHGYTSQQIVRCTAPDGTRLTIPHCLVVRVENDCITRIDEYLDRSTVAPLLAQIPGVMRPISR